MCDCRTESVMEVRYTSDDRKQGTHALAHAPARAPKPALQTPLLLGRIKPDTPVRPDSEGAVQGGTGGDRSRDLRQVHAEGNYISDPLINTVIKGLERDFSRPVKQKEGFTPAR